MNQYAAPTSSTHAQVLRLKLISCFPSTARILFPAPPTHCAATEPHPFICNNLGGVQLVWRGRPLTQKAREKGSGNQPILVLFHWNAAVGMRLLNTLAMAALIEQSVNKGVNKPHSISSTLKVLFPRIPGEWYHSGIG